jgi:plastocyanin
VCSLKGRFAVSSARKHTSVRIVAALFVASVFALAGCGGDDGDETTNGTSSQTFSISESDFTLTPSTVTIDAPGTYTFEATNDGGVDHALEIEGNGIEEETETIGPGDSASVTVDLETGTYEMYCPIGNHRELGMSGEVTVG